VVYCNNGCTYRAFDKVDPGVSVALVMRGGCPFVQKANMAEAAGALAVIVCDNKDSLGLPQMTSVGMNIEEEHLNIPVVSISKADGHWMIESLRVRQLADGSLSKSRLSAEVSWPFEVKQTVVKWELWAQAYSSEFLDSDKFHNALYRRPMFASFRQIAKALAPAVEFKPRFFVVPGHLNKCDREWDVNPRKAHCGRQCGNRGRYCTNDPTGDPSEGMDSVDMLEENLRQLCIYKWAETSNKRERWWNYVDAMEKQCYSRAHKDMKEGVLKKCSDGQRQKSNIPDMSACVEGSGGLGFANAHRNKLFEKEIKEELALGIHGAPAVTINGLSHILPDQSHRVLY
jgi:hypothetical protein